MTKAPQTHLSSPVLDEARLLPRARELLVAALGFGLLVTLMHAPVVFHGRTLVPSENMNPIDVRYLDANYGVGFIPEKEWTSRGILPIANLHDPGGSWWQGEPALQFFGQAVRSGQFPFWDPSAAAGAPAYTNLTSEFLFPPQMLLALAGATSTQKNLYILGLFWVAGFATYLLLRVNRVGVEGSVAGGLVFMLSGAMQQFGPSIFMGQVVACIPIIALVTGCFFHCPTWRRAMGMAVVYSVVSLASFPPILFMAFGFGVLYFVCLLFLETQIERKVMAIRYAVGVILSLGLVALYYLPVIATVRETTYATNFYRRAGMEKLDLVSIFDLLSPTAFGGPSVYLHPILKKVELGNLFYVGVTALLLAPLAFGKSIGRARALWMAATLASTLVALKVFGVPPIHWLGLLPGLQTFHYGIYFGILLAFGLALLAGLGLDRLIRREVTLLQVGASIAFLFLGLAALWFVADTRGALRFAAAWRWVADYRLLCLFATSAAFLTLGLLLAKEDRRSLAAYLLLILIFSEGAVNTTYPRQKRFDPFTSPPPYVEKVRAITRGSRLFIGATLTANLGSAFGIEALDSLYMFVPPRIYELYRTYTDTTAAVSMREAATIPPDPVLERAGIGYLLIRQQLPVLFGAALRRRYPFAYQDDLVALFKRGLAPRYFFSSDYQVVTRGDALKLVSTAPADQLLLETSPPFVSQPNSKDDPEPELQARKLNSLELKVDAPRSGLIYVADSFSSGWSAKVNGVSTPIFVANYAFRAVPISSGASTIELTYMPPNFSVGLAISSVSVLLILSLLCWGDRARFRVPSLDDKRPIH